MRLVLDLVLYAIGILFLLIGSALVDEARAAPPGDAGYVARVVVHTDANDVAPEVPASDSGGKELIRGRGPAVWLLEGDPAARGEREPGQIGRSLRTDRRRG